MLRAKQDEVLAWIGGILVLGQLQTLQGAADGVDLGDEKIGVHPHQLALDRGRRARARHPGRRRRARRSLGGRRCALRRGHCLLRLLS
jgi:hypothetical protein